jgi:glucose dehydrogenase
MGAMTMKRTIGTILALTGTLFLLLHLWLMVFTDLLRSYHDSEFWMIVGFLLAVAGLLLMRAADKRGGGI